MQHGYERCAATSEFSLRYVCLYIWLGISPELIVEFLHAAPGFQENLQKECEWSKQLLWQLGHAVEVALLGLSAEQLACRYWWKDCTQLGSAVDLTQHERAALLLSHNRANVALLKTCSVVAVGWDDSRVGRKPCKLVPVGFPEHLLAGWMAPQVSQCCPPFLFSKKINRFNKSVHRFNKTVIAYCFLYNPPF